ncbi:MAG TPA: hypothetical protein ENK31_06400 [Nannocystis exedens]|nr:hypothetical protein [Nannocystis exedens]
MLTRTEDLLRTLRRGGRADPEIQEQLASIVRTIEKFAPSISTEPSSPTTPSPKETTKPL